MHMDIFFSCYKNQITKNKVQEWSHQLKIVSSVSLPADKVFVSGDFALWQINSCINQYCHQPTHETKAQSENSSKAPKAIWINRCLSLVGNKTE